MYSSLKTEYQILIRMPWWDGLYKGAKESLINKRAMQDNRVIIEDSIDTRLDMKFRERSGECIRGHVFEWESRAKNTRLQTMWRKTVEGGRDMEPECCSNLTCAFWYKKRWCWWWWWWALELLEAMFHTNFYFQYGGTLNCCPMEGQLSIVR